MNSIRLMIVMMIAVSSYMHASEIAHIDEVARKKFTCQLFSAIIQGGSFEEISDLIAKGANVNAKGVVGITPCHHAAVFDKGNVIEILCKNNAYIDAKDDEGNTPLHYACRHGADEAVKVLLQCGANKWEENNKKHIPIRYAQKLDRKVIVEFIENYDPAIKEPEGN